MRNGWRKRAALVAAALALLVACAGLAVRPAGGRPLLPDFDVRVGAARLVGITTTMHLCPQVLNPDCYFLARPPRHYVYTIWLIRHAEGDTRRPDVRQVLSVTLGDRMGAP